MRKGKERGSFFRDPMALAGWVFADLLLGLAMLFFVMGTEGKPLPPSSTVSRSPTRTPTVTPSSTPSPLPSSTPTLLPSPTTMPTYTPYPALPTYTPYPTPQREGLEREAVVRILYPNPNQAAQLQAAFAEFRGNRRAGFVLLFGHAPTPEEGNRYALEAQELLLREMPDVFASATIRPLHFLEQGNTRRGEVAIEVYFLVGN